MASSINASTSGAGGVITTADNSGILNLQSGGTTVATVQSSGLSLPTGSTINTANTFGFKNRIINGQFNIAQRGTAVTVPIGTLAYTLDRWLVGTNTTTMTASQGTASTYPYSYLTLTGVAGNTGVSLTQRIESHNIKDLAGKTVTLSFYAYNASGNAPSGTLGVSYPTATDNYTSTTPIVSGQAISVSGSIRQSFTFTIPSAATTGLAISINLPSLTSGLFVVFDVQLEVGSQVTSWDFRDYGRELILCQRYCQLNSAVDYEFATPVGVNYVLNGYLPTTMRATPTVTTQPTVLLSTNATNGQILPRGTNTFVLACSVTSVNTYTRLVISTNGILSAEL